MVVDTITSDSARRVDAVSAGVVVVGVAGGVLAMVIRACSLCLQAS